MEIKKEDNNKIVIGNNQTGFITSCSVESNLLFAILEKLEEIRWGIIDVEGSVSRNQRQD